ncbi:MAG: methyltransferase domain-containing protein [Candidatus Schekmanbacteria bacterium]|nr:methyltransferase domain-containing protein [Candidatus Schekmanbacteria bacterium]
MEQPQQRWTAEEIEEAARGFEAASVLMAATELGVFAAMARKPNGMKPADLATAVGAEPRRLRVLLDALVMLGFAERTLRGTYRGTTGELLFEAHPDGLYHRLRHLHQLQMGWVHLAEVVRDGRPRETAATGKSVADLRCFQETLFVRSRASAEEAVRRLHIETAAKLLDVGGGAGAYVLAALEQNPYLEATIVDTSAVIDIAKEKIAAAGAAERVTFVAGDFFAVPFGGGFERVLLSNIAHIYSPEQNRALLRRCFEALAPGGMIGVKDFFLARDRLGPRDAVMFAVNMAVFTENGNAYTQEELAEWLTETGFAEVSAVRLESTRTQGLVVGRRPS